MYAQMYIHLLKQQTNTMIFKKNHEQPIKIFVLTNASKRHYTPGKQFYQGFR